MGTLHLPSTSMCVSGFQFEESCVLVWFPHLVSKEHCKRGRVALCDKSECSVVCYVLPVVLDVIKGRCLCMSLPFKGRLS